MVAALRTDPADMDDITPEVAVLDNNSFKSINPQQLHQDQDPVLSRSKPEWGKVNDQCGQLFQYWTWGPHPLLPVDQPHTLHWQRSQFYRPGRLYDVELCVH